MLTYDYNEDSRTNTADARILYIGLAKANESDEAFRYNLSGDADLVIDEADVQAYLDALVDKEVDADLGAECVKVEAGKEAKVSVNVDVTQAGKDYMDANFENGIYVEGFTMLEAQNKEGVDLSLPYLAFYGDWTEAPVIDTGFYWEEEPGHSQYPNVLLTKFGDYDWYPGINPYFPEAPINPEHISVSPNEDGYGDYISDIYVGLLRNAKTLKFTYENQQDPSEQYFRCEVEHAAKTYYVTQYDMMLPYVYSWKNPEYKLTDADGNVLANDTKVNLKIEAEIDYPLEDGRTANNDNGVVEIPFTVDTEAPVVIGNPEVSYDAESGKYFITLNFKDNVDVAGVHVLNKSATNVLESYAPEQLEKTENGYTVKLDVTGRGSELVLILGDYAMNESAYRVEVPGNEPVVDTNLLYGYRIADEEIADDTLFGWLGINPENAKTSVQSSEAYMDYALTAAEYVGGYIVAVDANNDFVFMKPGYWDERTKIRSLEVNIDELAFDPVGKVLYGYDSDNYKLVTIDLITGEVNNAGYQYLSGVVSMTCGNDGTLYGIDSYGNLKTINKETGEFDQTVLLETTAVTGLEPKYTQSMTYDAAEDCIYWAYCGSTMATGFKGVLYKIDVKNDYEMTKVGKIAGNAEVVGLLKLDSRGFELPADQPLEGISIEQESAVMLVKDKMPLTAVMTPWYAKTGGLVWSVEDSTIAKVEQDGVVTGINPGKTVVTVAAEDGKYQASCSVKVVQPEATVNGFVLGNQAQTLRNQWITADLQDMNHYTANTANHFMTYYAGEYVDGYIYAYNGSSEFYKINAETYEAKRVAEVSRKYQVIDMAYDYSGAYMYALVQEQTAYGMNYQLAVVDLETGNLKLITEYGLMSESGRPVVPCTLAVSTDGRIYTVGAEGMLYTYNPESGMLKEVGMTGYPSGEQIQCMAYDHNADALYWAMVTESFAGIAYVDTETGKAMPVGAIDGGMQMSSLFIVPEERPEGPGEIAVESVTMLEDVVALMEGSEKCVPVEVLPFNATDRKVTWTVADKSVAEINEGMITGKSAGTTAVTGTLTSAGQTFEVSFEIKVIKSAGEMHGYIMADFAMGFGGFWAAFSDTDLSTGEGIISDDSYQLTAGDYYDGKVYGYAIDMNSDTGAFEYVVLDGETLELEKKIPGDYPDFRDMAFDYSTGCMFGVAGLRSVFQGTSLYSVDITTGKCYEIGNTYTKMVYPSWDGSGDIVELIDVTLWGLACTTDGEMYGVDDTGAFYSVDKYTGELTKLFESNQPTNGYSSMACDHNTGNIYWEQAYRDMLSGTSSAYLYLVDPEEKSILEIGQVGMGGCAVTGMHVVPKNEISVGAPDPEHQKMLLNANSKMMKEGNSFELTAALAPISVKDTNLVYSYTSSDENVAVADSNGVITAVGAGKAVITVSCGEVRGECQINVVGADKKLHIVNKGGWETSPLLEPNTILDSVSFQNQFSAATATYHSDGYFYAIGEDGYLWKYTEDLGFVEKIGEKPVAEQFSDYGDFMIGAGQDPRVIDIVSESIAGTQEDKVYVLGFGVIQSMVGYAIGVYNIYELDLETGAAAMVGGLPFDIGNPSAMTFISEDELVVYDYGVQRMFKTKLNCTMNDSAEEILWTGNIVIPEGPMGMVYSQELNMVFMATADNMINGGRIALYTLDPVSGKLEKVSNASYNPGMVDLVIVEGTEPAKGES